MIVGRLYAPDDVRRDAGFSIFYMGINIGAMIAPIVCGYLGQRVNWHAGFAAAGVGMTLGLIQYQLGRRHLGDAGLYPANAGAPEESARRRRSALAWTVAALGGIVLFSVGSYTGILSVTATQVADAAGYFLLVLTVVFFGWLFFSPGWTPAERKRLYVIGVLFLAAALFWSEFEQAGSTLNLFADRDTQNTVLGWDFPSSWYQTLNSLFIIAFAPVFAWLWIYLGRRHKEPSSTAKFGFGLLLVGAGFGVLVIAAVFARQGVKVSPMWLAVVYLLHTWGELTLSPVGLSAMSKLAPVRIGGLVMGVWFLGTSVGNYIGGRLAAFYESMPLPMLFGVVAAFGIGAGIVMLLLSKPITTLEGRHVEPGRMVLEKYKAKRNFKESPEPAGDAKLAAERARRRKARRHASSASRNISPATCTTTSASSTTACCSRGPCRKDPSLDPSTKRLAMAVEDHPIEYGTFEGVIPSGYGAGIVMLWDRGTWTPEVDDVDAALKKGDLKFTLDGYKLKGSWVLVRTKGKWAGGGDRSWLLIKHRDEWAGDVDIAEFAPLSVKSGGDFADILAQDNPDIWISHRPAEGGEAGAMFKKIIERALEMKGASGAKGAKVRGVRATKVERAREAAKKPKGEEGPKQDLLNPGTRRNPLNAGSRCSRRSLSTLQTANARRRRSWRAISVHQNRPWTTSVSESNSPSSSGSLCSAAYRIRPSGDGRPVLAMTTSTGRPSASDTHRADSAAVKPAMPRPSVSRFEMRTIGPRMSSSASSRPGRAAAAGCW